MRSVLLLSMSIFFFSCDKQKKMVGLTVVRNVSIINPADETYRPGVDVAFNQNEIVEISDHIGKKGEVEIDGIGKYLLPGLIDAHVHIRDTVNLKLFLYHGVTTVRDMGGQIGDPLQWRDQQAIRELTGPRILAASPIISDSDPNNFSYPESSPHASELVLKYQSEGYDWIKTFRLQPSNFDAIATSANALGIPFGGHLPLNRQEFESDNTFTIYDVIRSGISSIEHLNEISNLFRDAEDGEIEALADSLLKYEVNVVTITWQDRMIAKIIDDGQDFDLVKQDSIVHYYSGEEGLERSKKQMAFLRNNAPQEARDLALIVPDQTKRVVRIFKEKGINLVVGTDTHNPPNVSGLGVLNELWSLIQYGLSPYEALQACTSNAAKLLKLNIGEVKEGFQADLILLRANPIEDIGNLGDMEGIFLDGKWLSSEHLVDDISNPR